MQSFQFVIVETTATLIICNVHVVSQGVDLAPTTLNKSVKRVDTVSENANIVGNGI